MDEHVETAARVEAHHVQLLSGRWTVEYRVVVDGYGTVGCPYCHLMRVCVGHWDES